MMWRKRKKEKFYFFFFFSFFFLFFFFFFSLFKLLFLLFLYQARATPKLLCVKVISRAKYREAVGALQASRVCGGWESVYLPWKCKGQCGISVSNVSDQNPVSDLLLGYPISEGTFDRTSKSNWLRIKIVCGREGPVQSWGSLERYYTLNGELHPIGFSNFVDVRSSVR